MCGCEGCRGCTRSACVHERGFVSAGKMEVGRGQGETEKDVVTGSEKGEGMLQAN